MLLKWSILLAIFCAFSCASKVYIDESEKFIMYESSTVALDSDVQTIDEKVSIDLHSLFTPYLPKSMRDLLSASDLIDRSKVLIDESKQRMFDFYKMSCPQNVNSKVNEKRTIITVGSFNETEEQKKNYSSLVKEFLELESKLGNTHTIHEQLKILKELEAKGNLTEKLLANEIKSAELKTKETLQKLLNGDLIESSKIRDHSNLAKVYNQQLIAYLGSKLTQSTCNSQSLDGVLITKSVHEENLYVGNASSAYAEFVDKDQFVKYNLPDVELTVNETIFGITIRLCNLELFGVYTCGDEAITHDCHHKTPTNCKNTTRKIGAGFAFVQQIGPYTNVYSNEKNYTYTIGSTKTSHPMPENGHLIIRVNSTDVLSIGNTTVIGHGESTEILNEFTGVDCSGKIHEIMLEVMTSIVIIFVSLAVLACASFVAYWLYKRIQRKSVQGNL